MLKEAIDKIVDLAQPLIYTSGERDYAFYQDHFEEIRPTMDAPELLKVYSLNALKELVTNDTSDLGQLFVSVEAYNRVRVYAGLEKENRWRRVHLYTAEASDVPGWDPKMEMGFDEATVALLTRFQGGGDKEYVLRLLSQITTGAKVTYSDNGIASTMVMTKGASLAENVTIKPIVKLRPYRTFQEVEQPEGLFLIRIRERGIAFIEADGGMWKLTARNTVKSWLQDQLKDCVGVTVML